MPMHDWTRTSAGSFHDFHNSWITHIKEALNDGLLPQPYYALGEQRAGDYGPDVLALKAADADLVEFAKSSETYGNMVAVEVSPPRVYKTQAAIDDIHFYLERQRAVTAWIEAYAVGDPLASMPLFLTRDHYIPLPLESTYELTWKGVPQRWKNVILGNGKASKGV